MNSQDIQELVQQELRKLRELENFHGITPDTIQQFLVDPFQVLVHPDDGGETSSRYMWIILQECKEINQGYLIAYDPLLNQFDVVEQLRDGSFLQVCGGPSFADALNGM